MEPVKNTGDAWRKIQKEKGAKKQMSNSNRKKWVMFFICALMTFLWVASGLALELKLESKDLAELYTISRQIEAQKQLNALNSPEAYASVSDYEAFERNPDVFMGDQIQFAGTVLQVVESDDVTTYRVAKDGKSSQVFYVTYQRPDDVSRILENDEVIVYAEFTGLVTYSSTINMSVSVPGCTASLMITPVELSAIQEATNEELTASLAEVEKYITEEAPKDSEGRFSITAASFDDYARNEARHLQEEISYTGKVLQVVEGDIYNMARIAIDGDSEYVVYTLYVPAEDDIRILESDTVTVVGWYTGLHTYSSTLGGEITIPSCFASSISPTSYKVPDSFAKDEDGNTLITKKTFEDFSRRPGAHTDESIHFDGNVLQVIEGNGFSEYRIAVDGDADNVIYVFLDDSSKTTRVLEYDDVTVYGRFDGTVTYESTTGVSITIPSCHATRIDVEGYEALAAQANEDGAYTITKSNYESFARDEASYINATISFDATVIQVLEGEDYTQYRMAIDNDLDCIFYAEISSDNMTIRLLENDEIHATGKYYGLYTYQSTLGGSITVPACIIESYTLDDYVAPEKAAVDTEGYYWITKDNYTEYARNADYHIFETIRFIGEVIQVVEGNSGDNVYRIAVDSQPDCIFYVEYTLPQDATRILEGDIVQLSGTYYGLYSYSTLLGSTITVPCTIATDIQPSHNTLKQGNRGTEVLDMKKRLCELGYFKANSKLSNEFNDICAQRLKEFQRVNGLPETGIADGATLSILYSDAAIANPDPY